MPEEIKSDFIEPAIPKTSYLPLMSPAELVGRVDESTLVTTRIDTPFRLTLDFRKGPLSDLFGRVVKFDTAESVVIPQLVYDHWFMVRQRQQWARDAEALERRMSDPERREQAMRDKELQDIAKEKLRAHQQANIRNAGNAKPDPYLPI